MPFKQGQSGNIKGKPKGAKNKISLQLREMITDFLIENFSKVLKDFSLLKPNERAKLYCDLLQYGLPKLQSISTDIQLEKLPEEQLDEIINRITKTNNH